MLYTYVEVAISSFVNQLTTWILEMIRQGGESCRRGGGGGGGGGKGGNRHGQGARGGGMPASG